MSAKSSSTSPKHSSRTATRRSSAPRSSKRHSLSPAVISFLTHRHTFLQAMPLGAAAVVI